MDRAIAIIPARYGSTRFPGKPLADATGQPLIQHVCDQARKASLVSRVIVATDDARIANAVRQFDGEVVMTRADHPNGTSRLAEVVENLPEDESGLIVNVQGDEPEIDPTHIDLAVQALCDHPEADVATLASPFGPDEDPHDPNIVKVVCSGSGEALYFSRALIPHDRDGAKRLPPLSHIGLYVYRRAFLLEYVTWPPSPLETSEHLEQLRILERDRRIVVGVVESHARGIDTPAQYESFVKRWKNR